jgi:preprotein translocase subunit SecE
MAENENKAKGDKKSQDARPNIFVRTWKRLTKWCHELKSELKKVQWPTRNQTIKNTTTVIACVLIVGVCIWVFDALAIGVVRALVNLFS